MDPKQVFKDFRQLALGRISQDSINLIVDHVRNDAVERVLCKRDPTLKAEIDQMASELLLQIMEKIKDKPITYPVQSDEMS